MWNVLNIAISVCFMASISCLFTACGGGGGTSGTTLVTSSSQINSMKYILSAQSVSSQNSTVPMLFTIVNQNGTAVLFDIHPTFSVYKSDTKVWDSTNNSSTGTTRNSGTCSPNLYTPVLSNYTSFSTASFRNGAGQTIASDCYEIDWNQKDSSGNQVSPGTYTVEGSYLGQMEQVSIVIQ